MMNEIPKLEIHKFKDGRKRVILGGIDLSFLISDIIISESVGTITSAQLRCPVVELVYTYEE